MNGNDFAKAIGINKPANVRDKIKKWQTAVEPQHGGVTNAGASASKNDDKPASSPKLQTILKTQPAENKRNKIKQWQNEVEPAVERAEDKNPAAADSETKPALSLKPPTTPKSKPLEEKPSWTPKHTPNKSVDASTELDGSIKQAPLAHNKLDEDVQTATAPKKRVISDSRWRNKQSPPKDTVRPSPKTIPNAWVRPTKVLREAPPPSPPKPPINPLIPVIEYVGKSRNKKMPANVRRRLSKPLSPTNDQRPTSSGSSNGQEAQSDENVDPASPPPPPQNQKPVMAKVRRVPHAPASPRAALSAEAKASTKQKVVDKSDASLSEEPGKVVAVKLGNKKTVSSRNDDIRERRLRARARSQGDNTADESPKIFTPSPRRRPRRASPKSNDDEAPMISPEVLPKTTTPRKEYGTRLEAWLSGTPDPFDCTKRPTRRKSGDSVSTLELHSKTDKSEVTASTQQSKDELAEESHLHSSGSGKRRRRRRRSKELKVDTEQLEETPTKTANEPSEKGDVLLTPTPTLKRRGAKRSQQSPTKTRAVSFPATEVTSTSGTRVVSTDDGDDVSTTLSSSVDSVPPVIEDIPLRPRRFAQGLFPSTGKRLSTIVSVDSFAVKMNRAPPSEIIETETISTLSELTQTMSGHPRTELSSRLTGETSTSISRRSMRRKRLASHADLISVLSMPKTGAKSIMSARSIRTNRSRLGTATIDDIMKEVASDEKKYMRELNTIVDGVIPVLLSCTLSKSDSAIAAGLFSRSKTSDPQEVTQPIAEMGMCLDRLKMLHKRVPVDEHEAFVSWAQRAQRVYADYIAAWRLGFQDVVISLAPADEDPFRPAKIVEGPDNGAPWDEGMPRNTEGYVVNDVGERVDIAYLLKRPLVRLKYLTKSLRGIDHVQPSDRAEKMCNSFQDLVTAARKRTNDEQARLEDEAAANIDATRSRDPRSLAPLAGVEVDANRCVRARDYFDLHLYHSSGQEVSCRVEILLRDNAPGTGPGGDVLFCEVDPTGRWLLLPPIRQSWVSARNGDEKGEIIVMIRGQQADKSEWSEVMTLKTDEEQAGFEWVHMLGLNPLPPLITELKRIQSPSKQAEQMSEVTASSLLSTVIESTIPQESRTPSPHEIDIPIGEQHTEVSKVWHYDTPDRHSKVHAKAPTTPVRDGASEPGKIYYADYAGPLEALAVAEPIQHSPRSVEDKLCTPRNLNEAMEMAGNGSPTTLKRTRATKSSRDAPSFPRAARGSRQITLDDPAEATEQVSDSGEPEKEDKLRRKSTKRRPQSTSSSVYKSPKGFSVWLPSDIEAEEESDEDERDAKVTASPPQRPQQYKRMSSVPSAELSSIPQSRQTSQPTTPMRDTIQSTSDYPDVPASAPARYRQAKSRDPDVEKRVEPEQDEDTPPPVPPHGSSSPATPVTLKGSQTPVLAPILPTLKTKRRSSSPLKHEYEPSTCTESSSSESEEEIDSEEDGTEEDEESVTSESTEDELDHDVPMPLVPIGYVGLRGYISRTTQPQRNNLPAVIESKEEGGKLSRKPSPPVSEYTLPANTITPSQSASNTPYRTVPHDSGKATKAIASIFAWSDLGRWDSLHPSECSIVVTPGKLEVFEISAMHSEPFVTDGDEILQPEGRSPLVAVELTPLVPLRKSTAIDISIRSPPTADSTIRTGNNIMLRSRNSVECAQLYAMINRARINNPTYIALQNARGPYGQTSWAEAMDRQNAARTASGSGSGWFGGTLGRRSSYRKTSTRAASVSAETDSSVGTMNTALRSALSRFSLARNGVFSVRNSTLGSRSTGSSFEGGSKFNHGIGSASPNDTNDPRAPGAPIGITNTKCRLYERETLKKWRDMGSARLTIMIASPNPSANNSPSAPTNPHQRAPGVRNATQERCILVTDKITNKTLLDVTLSESCFERVARCGIAVSVWEDVLGEDGQIGRAGKTGGVGGTRARVFMIQMKSEREAAYCFGMLGKLRY